jgi:uncharacterized cupin superfamily protein
MKMIDLKSFGDLSNLDLGPFAPKPTSFTDGQVEAAKQLWASDDGMSQVGVWECTPGRFSADRTKSSEICHILSGSATVVGKRVATSAGSVPEMFSSCRLAGKANGRSTSRSARPMC